MVDIVCKPAEDRFLLSAAIAMEHKGIPVCRRLPKDSYNFLPLALEFDLLFFRHPRARTRKA